MIFGAEGFIGGYLTAYLARRGVETTAASLTPVPAARRLAGVRYFAGCDVSRPRAVGQVLRRGRPSTVYLLAGATLPTASWRNPWRSLRVNVRGALNVLEGVRSFAPGARVFFACSSAEYGRGHRPGRPTREDAPLLPLHPYGVSKVAQDLLARQYFENYGVAAIRGRLFNTIGPGKTGEVASDIARQVVRAERGRRRTVRVGNVQAIRDFTDVRDMVRAIEAVTRRGRPGEVYNLASGRARPVQAILDGLLAAATVRLRWSTDPARLRPSDEPYIVGDPDRLRRATGWSPRLGLDRTLRDILERFRRG